MIRHNLFDGREQELVIFNRQAVVSRETEFFTDDCDDDLEEEEVDFDFPGFSSGYFRVYNERIGTLIKNLVLTQNGSALVMNFSVLDMTFEDNGNYWYEMGYVQSGGYEIALMFGVLKVK